MNVARIPPTLVLSRVGSSTAVVTLSLEADLEECHRRLSSGKIPLSCTTKSSGGSGSCNPAEVAVRPFLEAFEDEFDRTTEAIKSTEDSIESAARALLLNADALARKSRSNSESVAGAAAGDGSKAAADAIVVSEESIGDLREKAASLSARILQLSRQTMNNAHELRRIAHLADAKLGTTCAVMVDRRLEADPWTDELSGGGIIVVLLSDIYSIIRDIEDIQRNGTLDKDTTWVAPTSFERVTTKYWVKDRDLSAVMLGSVTELPLLVYGLKGGRILNQKASRRKSDVAAQDTDLWTKLASPISSVYFDSPDMRMYSERLKRNEGAKLFRIRWYGQKPKGDQIIFLELKTHHEKWVGDKSVKERVGIREKDVIQLLDRSTGSWDTKKAAELVRVANPKENEESIGELSKILLEMRALIVKFNLTPCVRTKYTRVALQSPKNNKLRLTIDRDITMIDERADTNINTWCLEDDAVIPANAMVKMPYCVFEVKVSGADGSPAFVTELEEAGAIAEAKKFSKFLSGASIFNCNKIETLPWWASDEAFAPLFEKSSRRKATSSRRGSRHNAQQDRTTSRAAERALAASRDTNKTPLPTSSIFASSATVDNSTHSLTCSMTSALEDRLSEDDSAKEGSGHKNNIRRRFLPRLTFGCPEESSPFDKPVASKSRARVEPKSYFANERTFIQWISAALLFVTISQLLWILASTHDVQEARVAGSVMIACSLFISVYALVVYYRRIYLMKNGKSYGYADFAGPGILTVTIISGVILLIVLSNKAQAKHANSLAVTMRNEPGSACIRRGLKGVPIMESQPSGIAIDKEVDVMLVASLNRIIAIPDGLPSSFVQVVADIPGANFEALEYVDNTLYAISENVKSSEVVALEWADKSMGGRHLVEIQRWKIPTPSAEAMALIPGEDPKLVIAGDAIRSVNNAASSTLERLTIDVFDLSAFDENAKTAEPASKMNRALVAKGLSDGKVGSMQYFEGLLYFLFDNDRVIRAFDPATGEIVQETVLPIAAPGSEAEWEGMRLGFVQKEEKTGGLRSSGGPASSLVLHLALDTPAQVWTLRLDDDARAGAGWKLPACAI